MRVSVLGTEYEVLVRGTKEDPLLEDYDGYTDSSTKKIVVCGMDDERGEPGCVGDPDAVIRRIMRHEIIHAFLCESGLMGSGSECEYWETNEEMVDWMACQWPKINRAFQECGCEDG